VAANELRLRPLTTDAHCATTVQDTVGAASSTKEQNDAQATTWIPFVHTVSFSRRKKKDNNLTHAHLLNGIRLELYFPQHSLHKHEQPMQQQSSKTKNKKNTTMDSVHSLALRNTVAKGRNIQSVRGEPVGVSKYRTYDSTMFCVA
jgi:hypothetical protein